MNNKEDKASFVNSVNSGDSSDSSNAGNSSNARSIARKKQVKIRKTVTLILLVVVIAAGGYFAVNKISDAIRTSWIASQGNQIVQKVLLKEEENYNRVHPNLPTPLLVNANNPISPGAIQLNLVALKGEVPINENSFQVDEIVLEPLKEMYKAAQKEDAGGYYVTSAYRSIEEQQKLYDEIADKTYVQKPGCSEHQTGLGVDLAAPGKDLEGSIQAKWLYAHSYEYGFIVRYPTGKENITGISFEPWHFRYVGVEIAKYIHDEGITLEEYVERANTKKDFTKKNGSDQ